MPRKLALGLAVAALAAGLALAVFHFRGSLSAAVFRSGFLLSSLAYFVFAMLGRKKAPRPAGVDESGRV